MSKLRIVLVEPQIPANLGFVARCLDNFGLDDWVAVNGCKVERTEAERTGATSMAILHKLKRCDSLHEAIADCDLVIGFTARDGFRRAPLPLHLLRSHFEEQINPQLFDPSNDTRVALVFGREDRGLEGRECESCSRLVVIPTAGLGCLNLSHAVAVSLYEWFRGRVETPLATEPPQPQIYRWASAEEKSQFAARVLEDLEASGFRHHKDQLHGALRRIMAQPIEGRDLRLLNKIARHVEWLREHHSART